VKHSNFRIGILGTAHGILLFGQLVVWPYVLRLVVKREFDERDEQIVDTQLIRGVLIASLFPLAGLILAVSTRKSWRIWIGAHFSITVALIIVLSAMAIWISSVTGRARLIPLADQHQAIAIRAHLASTSSHKNRIHDETDATVVSGGVLKCRI
jgi:hypothetical protein